MIDLNSLKDKKNNATQQAYVDDNGIDSKEVLTATEFVEKVVKPIIELQDSASQSVKKIVRGGNEYTPEDGVITLPSVGTTVTILTTASTTQIVNISGKILLPIAVTSVEGGTDTAEVVDIDVQVFSNGEYASKGSLPLPTTPFANPTYTSIDITEYLSTGNQQVRLVAKGRETNVTGRKVFNSIVLTTLRVEFASDYNIPVTGTTINPSYYIYGSGVSKVLHVKCSGKLSNGTASTREVQYTIGEGTYTISPYTGVSFEDSASQDVKVINHGVHKLEAWLTCVDSDGNTYTSEHIYNQLMVVADSSDTKPYLMLQNVVSNAVNYEQMKMMSYAVYNPSGNTDIAISVGNYSGDVEYLRIENKAATQTKYDVVSTIEVEGIDADSFYAYLSVLRIVGTTETNFIQESTGEQRLTITVDNSAKFAPVSGADFYLNPKTRNNSETNPATIINAAGNNHTAMTGAVFTNFGFVNDGWVTDEDGVKILRIMAGQKLTIPYEPFQDFKTQKASSMTIEFDFKVKNVTNESDAIIKCCQTVAATGNIKGIFMRPMEGYVMTDSAVTEKDQNFGWIEGERVHIAINIVHALKTSPTSSTTVSLVRVFVNNNINREFIFKLVDGEFIDGTGHSGIVIGQDDADIDIYSIRCYRKALSTSDIEKNYVATLKTSQLKLAYRAANDIMQDGLINYTKAKAKYNTMVWHGTETSHTDQASVTGWLEITKLKADGSIDKDYSGTICRDTATLPAKGQGSTAKTYYYWNQQYDIKKSVVADNDTTTPYIAKTEDDGSITRLPAITVDGVLKQDGWIDGNGVYRGVKYQLSSSTPEMQKAVLKINYASSMQSHKQGATSLYNDLHTAIVGKNTMQQANSKARVCVYEEPFLYFVQTPSDAEPVFKGLGTFGSGKMDEPTWGFNKSTHKDFMMLEGSDNNKPLTDMRCPWEDSKVTWNAKEEYYEYAGNGNIDLDKTGQKNDDGSLKDGVLGYPKDAWNFLFMHNPMIKPYVPSSGSGSYTAFIDDTSVDKDYQYWMTASDSNAQMYELFRWDIVDEKWVHAGMPSSATADHYAVKNLNTIYPSALTGVAAGNWQAANTAFIAAIVAHAKSNIGTYFNVESLKFHYAFVNHLLAGTDNCSKNTYYVLDPSTHLFEMHQDDMDTIFKTDNSGYQIKPYYIDRMHKYAEDGTLLYTEGNNNVLFNLIELMYEDSLELSSMLNSILSKMEQLVTADDVASGITKNAWGCFQKYFFSIQEYFPDCAYNETARLRYEYPESLNFVSDRGVHPIAQSLGSQLPSEKQYIKRRLVYMSSYAAYGEFSLNGDGGFGFEIHSKVDGSAPTVVLTVTPHQYLYPTGRVGQTLKNPHVRLAPNQSYRFVLDESGALGDTVCGLKGANYYKSFGNLGDLSLNPEKTFQIGGQRLTEIVVTPTSSAEFRTTTLTLVAPLVKTINLKGSTGINGQLDLTSLTRLRTVDVENTSITQVKMPQSELLTSVKMGNKIASLVVDNVPKLTTLTLQGYQYLSTISIGNNAKALDSYALVAGAYNANAPLTSVAIANANWTGSTAAILAWLCNMASITLTGVINVLSSQNVNQALKEALINKFGNVDSSSNPLYVTYTSRTISSLDVRGAYIIRKTGTYQYKTVMSPDTANNFVSIRWSITSNRFATINATTGVLTVTEVANESVEQPTATVTATVTLVNNTTMIATQTIKLYNRVPKVGDFAYSDGDFDAELHTSGKSIIGWVYAVEDKGDGKYLCRVEANGNINFKTTDGLTTFADSLPWGVYPNNDSNSIPNSVLDEVASKSGFASRSEVADIPTISNLTSYGNTNNNNYITNANAYDDSNTDGFATMTQAWGDFEGKVKTEKIIAHANKILTGYGELMVSSAGKTLYDLTGKDHIKPQNLTELADLLVALQTCGGNAVYRQLAYPAAYACYLYEPNIEGLDEQYKKNNWYLPSEGELVRKYTFFRNSRGLSPTDSGTPTANYADEGNANRPQESTPARRPWYANLLKRAANKGVTCPVALPSQSNAWSSTEGGSHISWGVYFNRGNTGNNGKFGSGVVRPSAAFLFTL